MPKKIILDSKVLLKNLVPVMSRIELMLLICLVIVTLFALRKRKLLHDLTSDYKTVSFELWDSKAISEARFLNVVALVYANELIRRDLEFFIIRFQELCDKANRIKKEGPGSMDAHLKTITSQYPLFSDFFYFDYGFEDFRDLFEGHTNSEIWELYEAIRLYEVMVKPLDSWKWQIKTDLDKDLERVKLLRNRV